MVPRNRNVISRAGTHYEYFSLNSDMVVIVPSVSVVFFVYPCTTCCHPREKNTLNSRLRKSALLIFRRHKKKQTYNLQTI